MQTKMNIKRETAIPLDRFWQEVFLTSLAKVNVGTNGAAVEADAALKVYQRRRSESQRRKEEFVS